MSIDFLLRLPLNIRFKEKVITRIFGAGIPNFSIGSRKLKNQIGRYFRIIPFNATKLSGFDM
jgi:hypothetical protein